MAARFVTPAPKRGTTKRIILIGSLAALLITALVSILFILDIVSGAEILETLGKSLAVVGVCTLALVLAGVLLRAGRSSSHPRRPAEASGRRRQ